MQGNAGWKWKVGVYRLTIGCSTCEILTLGGFR